MKDLIGQFILRYILKEEVKNGKRVVTLDLTLPLIAGTLFLCGLKMLVFPSISWWTATALLWFLPALIISLFAGIVVIFVLVTLGYWVCGKPSPVKWTRKLKKR